MEVKRDRLTAAYNSGLLSSSELLGGVFLRKTRAQRNQIGLGYRMLDGEESTLCFVTADNALYELIANPATATTQDSDWRQVLQIASGLLPLGTWDATNTDPEIFDTDAVDKTGNFYFVTGASSPVMVTIPGLFGGQTKTVKNGDLIVSNGTIWFVSQTGISWDTLDKPQVIVDYVNGTVIGHSHVIADITGLQTELDAKYDETDLAPLDEDFGTIPDIKLISLGFLKQYYYTKSETYTRAEIEGLIPDLSNYYTKAEVDALDDDLYLQMQTYTNSTFYDQSTVDQLIVDAVANIEGIIIGEVTLAERNALVGGTSVLGGYTLQTNHRVITEDAGIRYVDRFIGTTGQAGAGYWTRLYLYEIGSGHIIEYDGVPVTERGTINVFNALTAVDDGTSKTNFKWGGPLTEDVSVNLAGNQILFSSDGTINGDLIFYIDPLFGGTIPHIALQNKSGSNINLFTVTTDRIQLEASNAGNTLRFSVLSDGTFRTTGITSAMFTDSASTTMASGSIVFELKSTTKGFLLPRVTNIASVATPVNGMQAYDAATNLFNFRQGGVWVNYINKAGDSGVGSLLFTAGQGIDVVASGGSDVLNIGTSNSDVINIGWSGATVNIQGTLAYQNVTNLEVTDKLIRLNKGGGAASGVSSGFEIEESGSATGYFATNGTRDGWDLKAPAITWVATLLQSALTANRTFTLPDATGTFYVTGGVDVSVADGGTGLSAIAALSIWVANSSNTITTITPSAGQSVRVNAGGTAWEAYTGGDVAGPASATDNAIVRFDGATGKLVQDSSVIIDDSGFLVAANDVITQSADNQLRISAGASVKLQALKLSVSAALELQIVAASGISSSVDGQHSKIGGGSAYNVTGDGNGGDMIIYGGQRRTAGAGRDGSIAFNVTSAPNFQAMGKGTYFGNAVTEPTGNPADGVFLWAFDLSSSSKLKMRDEAGNVGFVPIVLYGSATLDFGSIAGQTGADLTITVTGAALGDPVSLGTPNGSIPNGDFVFFPFVSAANTVTVRAYNGGIASADPASGLYRVTVFKQA